METPVTPSGAAALLGERNLQHQEAEAERKRAGDEEARRVLDILQPPTKPGALGRLGHYEVLEVLGRGSFGIVVRAFDEQLHRQVAIKVMTAQLAATSPARKRFLREARSFAAICHENVVRVHAIEEHPIPFLVMEFVDGETLQQRLDRTGPLDPATVLRIGEQLAQGLAAAHAMGQIHRDIKPANILLENGINRVKITDFGLARAADDASMSQSGVLAGTPLYMAPEQAACVPFDQRADLFSLGSVLYVMCSGRPPFRAPTTLAVLKRVAEDTPRPIREIIPEVPQWLCAIITRLHAKKADQRFQTATEVAELLGKYLTELQLHGKVAEEPHVGGPKSKTKTARTRKSGWLMAAAAGVLALCGLGLTDAAGVTQVGSTVIRLLAPEGTLVVEVDDPDVSVHIDGAEIIIKGAGAKEIRLRPGQYQVQASKDGKVLQQELVTVTRRGRQIVRLSRELAAAIDPDRGGAEYALAIGGTIHIIENGRQRPLWPGNPVPQGAFDLTLVSLIRNELVNDAGLDHLKGCKFLENLDLERTKISPTKILEMKRALPWCKIEWDGDIKLLPISADRRAAEYVLSIGGQIDIKGGGYYRNITAPSALPQGSFDLRAVSFSRNNQKVTDAELAVFKNCPRLQSIHLRGTKVSDAGMIYLGDCKALDRLDLGETLVSDAGLAPFKHHLSLTGLGLSNTKITDAGLANFKYSPKLSHLDLGDMHLSDAGLAHFKDCKGLTRLLLSATKVSDAGLGHFKHCQGLAHLDVRDTRITDAGLAHFKDCKGLVQLDLSGTRVSDAGLTYFKGCQDLAFLDLNHTQISDVGLAHLKDCQNLNHLGLANSEVSDAGLAQILGYPKLYSLNVKNTKVDEAGVKRLAAGLPTCQVTWDGGVIEPTVHSDADRRVAEWLRTLPGIRVHVVVGGKETVLFSPIGLPKTPFELRRMYLESHPKMTDENVTLLQGLRHLTHLQISNCRMTEKGLAAFKDCKHLKELQLQGTRVTDLSVAQLTDFTELQYLNLLQTAVTPVGLKKLAVALPRCKIEWDGGLIECQTNPVLRPAGSG